MICRQADSKINLTPLDPVMKAYCICIALMLMAFSLTNAEIKNGYARRVKSAQASLEICNSLLLEDGMLAPHKRKAIKTKVNDLVKYLAYYELTERLLTQLKEIAPDLYNEIDNIRDANGQITDVYVMFIPEAEASVKAWGITGVAQVAHNANTYLSEFGERSVSVKVWAVSQALLVLSHEFGHVQYIVPNLATYKCYHVKHYRPNVTESNHIGHNSDDPSGNCAHAFEKRFRASYSAWYSRKNRGEVDSPAVLFNKIRREILAGMMNAMPLARL